MFYKKIYTLNINFYIIYIFTSHTYVIIRMQVKKNAYFYTFKEAFDMKIRRLLAILLTLAILFTTTSCYMISGQKMNKVKGTYKLTNYSYTPSHERREGYTPKTYDYINGEEYLYEDYLIITGSSIGYYVHKQVGQDAYVKEVTLSYEYSQDDSSKVEYIIYNDSITVNGDEGGLNRLGVNRDVLNYSKASFDYKELFTKREMRSESLSVSWKKVDKATDLSYVEEKLGNLIKYDYKSFSVRGIYHLLTSNNTVGDDISENKYQYFYYVIDTAENGIRATAYYALKDSPNDQKTNSVSISNIDTEWNSIKLDGNIWTVDPYTKNCYKANIEGVEYKIVQVSNGISENSIKSIIDMENSIPESKG